MAPPSPSRLTLAKLLFVVALLLAVFVVEVHGKRHYSPLRSRGRHGGRVPLPSFRGANDVSGAIPSDGPSRPPIIPPNPQPLPPLPAEGEGETLPVPPFSPIGPAPNPDRPDPDRPDLPVEPPTPVQDPVPGALGRAFRLRNDVVPAPMFTVPDTELRGPLEASIGDASNIDERELNRERDRPFVPPFRPVGPLPPRIVPVGPERPPSPIVPVGPERPQMGEGGEKLPPTWQPDEPAPQPEQPPQMGEGGEKLPPTWRPDEPERPPQMGEGGEKLPPAWTPDDPDTPRIHPVGPERQDRDQMGEGGEKLPPDWTPDVAPGVATQSDPSPPRRAHLLADARAKARSVFGSLMRLARLSFVKVAPAPEPDIAPSSPNSASAPVDSPATVDAAVEPSIAQEEPTVAVEAVPLRNMAMVTVDPRPAIDAIEPAPMPMPGQVEPAPARPEESDKDNADENAVETVKERRHPARLPGHGKHKPKREDRRHRRPHHGPARPPVDPPQGPTEPAKLDERQRHALQKQLHKLRKHLRKIDSLLGPSSGSASTRQFNDEEHHRKRHRASAHMLYLLAGAGGAIAIVALLTGCWALRNKRRRRMMEQQRVMQQPFLPTQAAPAVGIPVAMPPGASYAYQPLAHSPHVQQPQAQMVTMQQQPHMAMPQVIVQ